MISGLADSVLVTFIVFCRIGARLMLVPGFSSVTIPAQVRLFVALVTTFALAPLLTSTLRPLLADAMPLALAFLICSELLIGSVIGLGEAGYGPAGGALLSTIFPARLRGTIVGAFLAAASLGAVLGVMLGGLIAAAGC